jgi:hypothetical protein
MSKYIKNLLLHVHVSYKINVCKFVTSCSAIGCTTNPSGVITTWDEVPQRLEGLMCGDLAETDE